MIAGHSVTGDPRQAKAITAYVPDRPELFPYLTALETMRLTASLYSLEADAAAIRAEELLETFGLKEWAKEPVSSFSHGMKQKLSVAAALLHKPQILILDEPMVGLDPKGGRLIKEVMRRLADKGCTVFMSIHTLEIAEKICDRLGILYQGQLLTEGTVDEVKAKAGGSGGEALEDVFLKLTGDEEGGDLEGIV
jgi:ABC-2 type transport system ATP-binding protein